MKLNTLLVINALLACVFGLAFVLIPSQVYPLYAVEPNAQLNFMGQLFGVTLLTIALVTYLMRNVVDPNSRKSLVSALFVGNGIGFVVSLIGQLSVVVSAFGWSTVAIYFLLALGFASLQFRKQPGS